MHTHASTPRSLSCCSLHTPQRPKPGTKTPRRPCQRPPAHNQPNRGNERGCRCRQHAYNTAACTPAHLQHETEKYQDAAVQQAGASSSSGPTRDEPGLLQHPTHTVAKSYRCMCSMQQSRSTQDSIQLHTHAQGEALPLRLRAAAPQQHRWLTSGALQPSPALPTCHTHALLSWGQVDAAVQQQQPRAEPQDKK